MKKIISEKYQNISQENIQSMAQEFAETGILIFEDFLSRSSLYDIQKESEKLSSSAYRSTSSYNLFVEQDSEVMSEKLKNTRFTTEKQCICYDEISQKSYLKQLYNDIDFQGWLCQILKVPEIFPYTDPLSSININYYKPGDSLQWHYDNCNFTITLLIKKPEKGGVYEYFPNQRYNSQGEEDYQKVEKMIDGSLQPERVNMDEGTLILFRGTESLHRVSEIIQGQRILVTFCYNLKPGVSLSETSRMTFFGRLN